MQGNHTSNKNGVWHTTHTAARLMSWRSSVPRKYSGIPSVRDIRQTHMNLHGGVEARFQYGISGCNAALIVIQGLAHDSCKPPRRLSLLSGARRSASLWAPHCYSFHHQIASCQFHAHAKQFAGHDATPWPARGECSHYQKRWGLDPLFPRTKYYEPLRRCWPHADPYTVMV
jgi:hypothetical protein